MDEIDETGYAPLRHDATRPPAPGFVLASRQDIDGLILLRFRLAGTRGWSPRRRCAAT